MEQCHKYLIPKPDLPAVIVVLLMLDKSSLRVWSLHRLLSRFGLLMSALIILSVLSSFISTCAISIISISSVSVFPVHHLHPVASVSQHHHLFPYCDQSLSFMEEQPWFLVLVDSFSTCLSNKPHSCQPRSFNPLSHIKFKKQTNNTNVSNVKYLMHFLLWNRITNNWRWGMMYMYKLMHISVIQCQTTEQQRAFVGKQS